ncbi:MAG: (Fe-S)-binding protein [Candidatus Hodarchaeota archaeon]
MVETKENMADVANLEKIFTDLSKSNRYFRYYLENCVRCGACIEACHFYQGDKDNALNAPVFKNEQVRRLVKQKSLLGRLGFFGRPKENYTEDLTYAVFESCTNCRRCVMFCPFSIDISLINTAARSALIKIDKAPEMLLMIADMQIQRRESPEDYIDDFKDQIRDHEEAIREEIGDPSFRIPVAEKGADILYIPLSGAHTILPAAKIFHAAGENWTLSIFDSPNYGFLAGDVERAKKITKALLDEAKELGVKKLVISECGHGFRIMKQFVKLWFDDFSYEVELIAETVANYIREDKIHLDKSKNADLYTHHDPCQHARNAGVFEESRYVLQHAVSEFVEMTPNRTKNWCCGGGGGVLGDPEFEETRLKGGKMKAEQIKATGAKAVSTTCDNCLLQIRELNDHYKLDVQIDNLTTIVSRALVYQKS